VNVKIGELFSGVTMSGPQIQIVNNNDLSVKADVPENYVNKVKQGGKVVVEIPSIGKTYNSTISKLSQSINAGTRGFTAECKIPTTKELKPNMAAMIKVLSHSNSKAIVIPINIVQNDDKGKYVFVLMDKDGKKLAHKKNISLGDLYGDEVEVMSGLTVGDKLITQGYQDLYEGQLIQN
jgi:RND family efflux transporter MFP subunit